MGFLSGIIGIGSALLGNNSAKKQQKSADEFNQQSIDLQREQLQIAKDRQEDYEQMYNPLEKDYLELVKDGVTPDYERVTNDAIGDVNSQFEGAEAARLRQLQRTGVNPNSGRADALGRNLSLSRALSLTGTINKARQHETDRAEDLGFARKQDALQIGINKLNGAQSSVNSASSALSQTYANQANKSSQDASNTMKTWADLGSTVYQAWDQHKNKPAKTTVGTGVWM